MRVIVYMGVYLLLAFYVGWNGFLGEKYSSLSLSWIVYWVLFLFFTFSYILARWTAIPPRMRRAFKVIGSYYFAVFEYAIILLIPADAVVVILKFLGFQATSFVPIISSIVLLLLILLLAVGSWNAWMPVIRRYELTVAKRTENIEELRILVASDIHLGNLVGNRHLQKFIKTAERIQPNLILLPGDVLDGDMEPFERNQMGETLKQLSASYGVFAVLGNHEYYENQVESYVQTMSSLGIHVLQDEFVFQPSGFYIAGRKDKTAESPRYGGHRMIWSELLSQVDKNYPVIAMDHQPLKLEAAAAAGVDVLLCGHTHRGQFAPNHWITRRLFELDWGYLLKGKMHTLVSSGFGTWGPPIRLASQSELLDITIRFNV